jgi:hypothetical protein
MIARYAADPDSPSGATTIMSEYGFPLSRRHLIGALATAPLIPSIARGATPSISRLMVQGRPQDTQSPYKLANILPALDKLGGASWEARKAKAKQKIVDMSGGLIRIAALVFRISAEADRQADADNRTHRDDGDFPRDRGKNASGRQARRRKAGK